MFKSAQQINSVPIPPQVVVPESVEANRDDTLSGNLKSSSRLLAIQETGLLNVPAQFVFRLLTELVSRRLKTPVSLITFVTDHKQFFVSSYGLAEPWTTRRETPLTHSFCQHVTTRNEPLVIHDARQHPLVCENLAIRDLNVTAYLGVPLVDDRGNVLGSFCTIDDKPREWTREELAELKSLSTEVVHEIGEYRRSELEKEVRGVRSRQSEKMAAIGTLAGSIAHDFNNILMVVQTYSELIVMRDVSPQTARKYAKVMLATTERAKGVVEQLVSWHRPNEEARQPISLRDAVEGDIPLLRALLPTSIELNLLMPEDDCSIVAAPGEISRIMINLASNAEFAMRESGGELTIAINSFQNTAARPSVDLPDGCYVSLNITDTGCGIPESIQDRVCDPFFTTKSTSDGSGIGLSVVYGIVSSLGGTLEIQSNGESGTTIRIAIPKYDAAMNAESETFDAADGSVGQNRLKVLLVDDEPAITQGLHHMLTAMGHVVASTTNSQEALAMFQEAPESFDLLVTDQTMPAMTGEKLIKAIHEISPTLPTIMMTGFSHVIDEGNAEQHGVSVFARKPVSASRIAQAIEQALSASPEDSSRRKA